MNTKVCILTSVHQAFDVRIYYKEARSLAKAGYQVTLIARAEKDEIRDGIKIISLPRPKNRKDRIARTTLRLLREAIQQDADIYHFHDSELILAGLFLKLRGKKVLQDVHEDLPAQILSKEYIPSWQRKPLAKGVQFWEKTISHAFDHIITATDHIAETFHSHSRVTTIKNFPVLQMYDMAEHSEKKSKLSLIYAGGLLKTRGITQIVQALEYLDDETELILLGEFTPSMYEKEVKEQKGFAKVSFLGKVPFEKVLAYYASADIGIACFLPEENHLYAMPNKLFEYMATGLPVIVSDFPLWREIIEDAQCGLCVDPANPHKIAEAILYLQKNPHIRKQMGANGKKAVREKYNWETEEKKLLAVYQGLH